MRYELQALAKQVIVRRRQPAEKAGSIFIPESARRDHIGPEGDVISVGPDVTALEPGDHVIYKEHAGQEVDLNEDERYTVLPQEDVVAKIVKVVTEE